MKHSLLEACHFVCSFVRLGFRNRNPHYKICLFLLVTVLSQSFFAFVSSHLVAFSFLSAWHNYFILKMLLYFFITGLLADDFETTLAGYGGIDGECSVRLLNLFHENLCRLECRYLVLGNDECRTL